MADLPSGTVTFLFTDIEGSTQLLKQLGRDTYAYVQAEHERLLRNAFAEAGGQEIDTQGDAFFVAFRSAADAVRAAQAAQLALAAESWPGGVRVAVRMGVHTGEPTIRPSRYAGLGVHRAARICSAGHGGVTRPPTSSRAARTVTGPFELLSVSESPRHLCARHGRTELARQSSSRRNLNVRRAGPARNSPPWRWQAGFGRRPRGQARLPVWATVANSCNGYLIARPEFTIGGEGSCGSADNPCL